MIIKLYLFCLLLFIPYNVSMGQDTMSSMLDTEEDFNFIEIKLRAYMEDLEFLVSEIDLVSLKELEQLDTEFQLMNTKHSFYCQAQQAFIVKSDSLMNLVAYYQQQAQIATDLIQKQFRNFQMQDDFKQAEDFIMSQDSIYERMLRQTMLLSQIEETASELEKIKGYEQLIFADVEKQFQQAKVAAELIPSLKIRQKKLEEKYIELKNNSESIQNAEYQPFFQRVKDKLIGIAAIGVILMLVNTILTKIQSIKNIRESQKKMEEMMQKTKKNYPKI